MRLRRGVTGDDGQPANQPEPSPAPTGSQSPLGSEPRVLIGGVGYWWAGDASFGLVASEEMAKLDWPPGVEIADLGYGALYVVQDLANAEPSYDRLILIVGMERGRTPGEIYVERWLPVALDPADVQARICEAGAGVVDIDHLLVIAHYFKALPEEVIVIEVEPSGNSIGHEMSGQAMALLPQVVEMVRRIALVPLGTQVDTLVSELS